MSDPVERLNAALEGRYSIERELGEGGMATVYLAKDPLAPFWGCRARPWSRLSQGFKGEQPGVSRWANASCVGGEGVRTGAGSSRRGRLPRASRALGPDLMTDS